MSDSGASVSLNLFRAVWQLLQAAAVGSETLQPGFLLSEGDTSALLPTLPRGRPSESG